MRIFGSFLRDSETLLGSKNVYDVGICLKIFIVFSKIRYLGLENFNPGNSFSYWAVNLIHHELSHGSDSSGLTTLFEFPKYWSDTNRKWSTSPFSGGWTATIIGGGRREGRGDRDDEYRQSESGESARGGGG